jgi:hypothetical protein
MLFEKNKKSTNIQVEAGGTEYFSPGTGFGLRGAACFVCATVP